MSTFHILIFLQPAMIHCSFRCFFGGLLLLREAWSELDVANFLATKYLRCPKDLQQSILFRTPPRLFCTALICQDSLRLSISKKCLHGRKPQLRYKMQTKALYFAQLVPLRIIWNEALAGEFVAPWNTRPSSLKTSDRMWSVDLRLKHRCESFDWLNL